MAKKVGLISINLMAGTAQFNAQMPTATAQIRNFGNAANTARAQVAGIAAFGATAFNNIGNAAAGAGQQVNNLGNRVKTAQQHLVSGNQAASGFIRVVEGGMANNLRAVENFLTRTLGLGPALQVLFPLVGAIAFAGLIIHLGEEVYAFFKKLEEGPARVANAFRILNAPLQLTNDELRVTGDRLTNDIAKLEGRRENTLKLALDEARVAADKLSDSLDKDLKEMNKLLSEEEIGRFKGFFTNTGSTTWLKEFIGGKDGLGGVTKQEQFITSMGNQNLAAAADKGDAAEVERVKKSTRDALIGLYRATAETIETTLTNEILPVQQRRNNLLAGIGHGIVPADQSTEINQARGVAANFTAKANSMQAQASVDKLQEQKDAATAADNNARLDRPVKNKMGTLQADLQESALKLSTVHMSEEMKTLALANAAAVKSIDQVNKALEALHEGPMTKDQQARLHAVELGIEVVKQESDWQTKMVSSAAAMQERIDSQRMLTAAVNQGYEATKRAAVLYDVAKTVGFEKFNDPKFMSDPEHQHEVADLTAKSESAYAEKNRTAVEETLKKLREHTVLEVKLAQVQRDGAEAVRRATLAMEIQNIVRDAAKDSVVALVLAKQKEYGAERQNANAIELDHIMRQIEATGKLAAAQIAGAEAVRRARLEIKYDEMKDAGSSQENIDAARRADRLDNLRDIDSAAASAANADRDSLYILQQRLKATIELKDSGVDELGRLIEIRDLHNQILDIQIRQLLALGSISDGFKAFFYEMQKEAEKPGKILYDGLHNALNGLDDNLTRIMTGQKSAWADMFKSVGRQMVHDSVGSMLKQGLGALGKTTLGQKLGLDKIGAARKDGQTDSSAFKVQVVGGTAAEKVEKASIEKLSGPAAIGNTAGTIGSILGGFGRAFAGSFGGGGGGGPQPQNFYAGIRDGGGDVSADKAYVVGGNGPELLRKTSGTIVSNSQSKKLLGGGGHTYHVAIDARGTDPVLTEQRTYRAMIAAHNSAVGTAVKASVERARRVPTGG